MQLDVNMVLIDDSLKNEKRKRFNHYIKSNYLQNGALYFKKIALLVQLQKKK